jgi:glycosyltransferase involved in cell wall biosynthesis
VNLLRPLFEIDQKNEYLVALSAYEPSFETPSGNVHQWVMPVSNRFLKRIYAQAAFPWKMRDYHIVHFTKNLSLWGPMPPKILTVYDLSMLRLPGIMPRSDYLYWRTFQKKAVQDADCIITISKDAAKDIVHFYEVPEDKIRVIYPGIGTHFRRLDAAQIAQAREKYHLPERYLVHVGRIDPIKNLTTAVKAFARLRERGAFDGKLVLIGEEYKKTPDSNLVPTIQRMGLQNEVILAGYAGNYVCDDDLPAVIAGAVAKVFPSLNEGFGFAPLEAMACGTPVIASRSGSLPEVLGDAALLLEQNDVEILAQAMERVVNDAALREKLRARGLEWVKRYNWYENARQTLDVYEAFARK